ncbi:MAG: Fic family protein [Nanoarchaeota archaeon]|nr:Fic family protein [Nanoarchaeota archaeon]
MVVAHSLNEEIERKRYKISNEPKYFLKRSQRIKRYLKEVGNVYSFWLEHPELRERLLAENGVRDGKQLRHEAIGGVGRIEEAWRYLHNVGESSNFISSLTPDLIKEIGMKVEPFVKGFRDSRVSLGFDKYTPPNPVKVPDLIDKLCNDLKNSDYSHVEVAAVAHLNIAGIQPFVNGNKRTARLIQDRILEDYGLPPAVIPSGERIVYLDLLEEGLVGIRDNKLDMQRPFFDYIAGKVNTALDEILNDLFSDSHKKY